MKYFHALSLYVNQTGGRSSVMLNVAFEGCKANKCQVLSKSGLGVLIDFDEMAQSLEPSLACSFTSETQLLLMTNWQQIP